MIEEVFVGFYALLFSKMLHIITYTMYYKNMFYSNTFAWLKISIQSKTKYPTGITHEAQLTYKARLPPCV